MGTSSSGSGPIGRNQLLPNWAIGGGGAPDDNDDTDLPNDDESNDDNNRKKSYADDIKSAKGLLTRIANGRKGSTFKSASRNYVRRTGGHRKATQSAGAGISAGGNYLGFLRDVSSQGFNQTLNDYDLSDCIGKSTEEVLAKVANKIAPIGSTNDEAIARAAIMMAFDKLCEKLLGNGQDITSLDQLDEATLKDTVVEFVSAYIFKKWVYEAGLALERNDLSESEAIELENEMRDFVTDEVKQRFGKKDVKTLDISQGEGKKIVENIFDLAYSTLEK